MPGPAVQRNDILMASSLAEPDPLHFGHMADDAKQTQARRRQGSGGHLDAGQSSADVQQVGPLPVQVRLEHGSFIADQRSPYWGGGGRGPGHGPILSSPSTGRPV